MMSRYRQLSYSVKSASVERFLSAASKSLRGRSAVVAVLMLVMPAAVNASTKVAFIADQGAGSASGQVLSMIAGEGVDLVLIQGDLGYKQDTATLWESHLDDELGKNFPVLSVVGNHENFQWPLYQRLIEQRVDRADGLSCSGEVGVKARCQFGNLDIVQVAPGITEVAGVKPSDDYDGFIRSSFKGNTRPWRICSWHKNQTEMQIYKKGDAVGWDVFDACLDAGAMVVMGHAHTYSRTFQLSNFRKQTVAHTGDELTLAPGSSFAVVSGLGGRDIKSQLRGGDQFAAVYSATQGATHGALFCDFGDTTAQCYFKSIDGALPDRFTITNKGTNNGADTGSDVPEAVTRPVATLPSNEQGVEGVFSRTDKSEYRWIAKLPDGKLGNIWIDSECARQMGSVRYRGNWGDLVDLAPALDSVANPCSSGNGGTTAAESSGQASPPPPAGGSSDGYVFSRTDKTEYRWIERMDSGVMGNIWIEESCAVSLGGAKVRGSWKDLDRLAPEFDAVANPCYGVTAGTADTSRVPDNTDAPDNASGGYVFERSDKDEYRWIDRNSSGQMGSVWVDEACAARMGGTKQSGRWSQLMQVAPGFDTIAYPC